MTEGQEERRTGGQKDRRTEGEGDRRTGGEEDRRTGGGGGEGEKEEQKKRMKGRELTRRANVGADRRGPVDAAKFSTSVRSNRPADE